MKNLDWDNWKENMTGWLGIRGEVFVSSDECPRAQYKCDDCPVFMGHKKEGPAYVGDNVRFCCGDKF